MNKGNKRVFIKCFSFPISIWLKYTQNMAIQMSSKLSYQHTICKEIVSHWKDLAKHKLLQYL